MNDQGTPRYSYLQNSTYHHLNGIIFQACYRNRAPNQTIHQSELLVTKSLKTPSLALSLVFSCHNTKRRSRNPQTVQQMSRLLESHGLLIGRTQHLAGL